MPKSPYDQTAWRALFKAFLRRHPPALREVERQHHRRYPAGNHRRSKC